MELAARSVYRGQLTKIVKASSEYLSSSESRYSGESSVDDIEEELTTYIQRLTAVLESLRTSNKEVAEKVIVKPEQVDQEAGKIAEYEDSAISTLARLQFRLKKITEKTKPVIPELSSDSARPRPHEHKFVALPKLQLKKFDGKDWLPFWEQFRTAVHENVALTPSEKFNYLESTLLGSAKRVIAGFSATEQCYDTAISLLQEQFGDNERLIDSYIQQLVSLRPVHSRSDVHGLRQLYTSITTCRRSLAALNVPSHQYDVMLKSVLLRCLPNELRLEYHRVQEKDNNIVSELDPNSSDDISDHSSSVSSSVNSRSQMILHFLKREISALERSNIDNKPVNSRVARSLPTSSASSLVSLAENNNSCLWCNSTKHQTSDCRDDKITLKQKRDILVKDGRCFRCAKRGHSSRKCNGAKWLKCRLCKGKHITSLCDPNFKEKALVCKSEAAALCSSNCQISGIFLKTARCIAHNSDNNQHILIRTVIDGGSQSTYILESVAKQLNLTEISKVKLSVMPFGSSAKTPPKLFSKVIVGIKSQYTGRKINIEALVVPAICTDVLNSPTEELVSNFNLPLADKQHALNVCVVPGLSLLIGADFYWDVVTGNQKILSPRLRGVETIFGWTIQGVCASRNCALQASSTFVSNVLSVGSEFDFDMASMWNLESIGIRGEIEDKNTQTSQLSERCIRKNSNRYIASLPWKDDSIQIVGDRNNAITRLDSLVRRLSRNPAQLSEYATSLQDLVTSNIAEPVPKDVSSQRIFYLPHHPVYKEDSQTTRLRIVFDASYQHADYPSLNSFLVTGTNLLADIFEILLNFRMAPYAMVADIEKAFLQIELDEADRDSHRFVWLDTLEDRHYKDYRMTRVTFGVKCSPFLLAATILKHLKDEASQHPRTCELLRNGFYMDDLILGIDTEEDAIRVYKEAVAIMKRASMNLRKWNSNSVRVRAAFTDPNCAPVQKVLGMIWYTNTDELQVPIKLLEPTGFITSKRNVLQTIARIYDPLGITAPVVIKLKIIFQDLWKRKIAWDDTMPEEMHPDWIACLRNLRQLSDMMFPRSALSISQPRAVYIHIFADASLKAYGAVAYVKSISDDDQINVSLLCSKSRVAPLKESTYNELTLPKLELTAALIAARLRSYLEQNLRKKVTRYYLWSDSKIALYWISGKENRWKPYVQNRVDEIRKLTNLEDWSHCSGKQNPADLITRGVPASKIKDSSIWFTGPSWLYEQEEDIIAVREDKVTCHSVMVALMIENPKPRNEIREPLCIVENFSSWLKLLRVTCLVQRFVKACRLQSEGKPASITAEDMEIAELYWIRHLQMTFFHDELQSLQKEKRISPTSKIAQLSPYLDHQGVLRLGGRLQLMEDTEEVKHPVILPAKAHITHLIVDYTHLKTYHGGINTVLSSIREKYWIIKGRQIVKSRIKRCVTCRKLFGVPASQPFAPLPLERISLNRPFDNVGVDFAGPLFYLDSHEMHKSYIMIFTCAAVRAVHLELVPNLTTDGCLMAIRRFIARRGVPSAIFSDNAKTFRRASMELSEAGRVIDDDVLQGFLANKRIKWKFIVERAPWWGGFWERLIRTVKNTLKVAIGKAKLNFDQLRTLLAEAEAIANDRPLTYVTSDPLDLTYLTPNHFLITAQSSNCSAPTAGESDCNIRQLWKTRLQYINKMVTRWRIEYVQSLRLFHRNVSTNSENLKEGDVVLLFDQAKPRIHWKLALIEKTHPGRDGKVRSCEIRCSDGKSLRRPIQLLYPLEISTSAPAEDVKN